MLLPVLIAFESLTAGETCPASADVQSRVRTILHLSAEQQLSESFLVERHEAGLYVVLKSADATTIGERTLPLEGSCDELAQAAAVVLSAWLTDVHPDFAGALPTPAPAPAPEPEPEPQATARASAATTERREPVDPERRPPQAKRSRRVDLALGLGGDLTSGAIAPAALVSVGYGPETGGFGLTAFTLLTTSREEPLGPGLLRWRRWPLGIGPVFRLSTAGLRWDLSAGPALAWLRLAGESFDVPDTQDVPAWGGFLGLRASGQGGPLAPFGLVNLQVYPGDSVAYVDGTDDQWPVPMASIGVTLGVRFAH